MIVAGGDWKKRLYKIDRRILEAREEAVRELLDELYNRIIKLQAENSKSYADVLDIIDEYRKALLVESAQLIKGCVCPHPGHLCRDCRRIE